QACPTRPDRRDAGRPLERARARGAAVGRGSTRPGCSGRRVIPTAPLRIRNRLAEIILAALEKPEAHRELAALGGSDAAPDWLEGDGLACRPLVRARALSALAALAGRTARPIRSRTDLLDAAAALFDAPLYFEVHELLEPPWREADGDERGALRAQVQVAVGQEPLAQG